MNRFSINRTWNGLAVDPRDQATVEFVIDPVVLTVRVEAPFHGDRAPASPPGSTDGLWEYEVVELFLLGAEDAYLEIELGPHGHYLVLQLKGERRVVKKGLAITFEVEIDGRRWRGTARIPLSYLPPRVDRANAYAISGEGENRRYLAAFPTGGEIPDFHKLSAFAPVRI